MNLAEIEALCQSLESVFARWKRGEPASTPAEFDLLHQAVDLADRLVAGGAAGPEAAEKSRIKAIIQGLENAAQRRPAPTSGQPPREKEKVAGAMGPDSLRPSPEKDETAPEYVRVSLAKLQGLLQQSEEFLSARLAAGQIRAEASQVNTALLAWRAEWDKIQPLLRALPRHPGTGADLTPDATPGVVSAR